MQFGRKLPLVVAVFSICVAVCLRLYFVSECHIEKQDISGKTFIITGGSAGLGKETARVLVQWGGDVIIGCRNATKAAGVVAEIGKGPGVVEAWDLDLSSFESVRAFARRFLATNRRLHVLINNAMCAAGVVDAKFSATVDGFESNLQVNHLSHFLLTRLLLDRLISSAVVDGAVYSPARVVSVSSDAFMFGRLAVGESSSSNDGTTLPLIHDADDGWFKRYSNTKLMNLLFASELQRRVSSIAAHAEDNVDNTKNLGSFGYPPILAFSVHPGVIATDIIKDYPWYIKALVPLADSIFLRSVEDGAKTQLKAATAPDLLAYGGRYFENCAAVPPATVAYKNPQAAAVFGLQYFKSETAHHSDHESSIIRDSILLASRLWEVSDQMVGLA